MKRILPVLALLAVWAGAARANGLVIPNDKTLPPLAMLNHRVDVTIQDQVAVTKVEQTFRNHTARPLEATYVFPVPKGASVREFSMWVDGKKVAGELVEAAKARQIYTDIVRRTQDPGLLEYLGADVLKMQIFPIPPHGDQKIALSFTSVAKRENGVVEYTYPLRTDGKATRTLEEFSLKLNLKAQEPIINVYSPTHAITISRAGDKEATVTFDKQQAILDKDFQLFYTTNTAKEVGLTALQHRPIGTEDGYFLMLVSPRFEVSKAQVVPRDVVFVIDTSGSMREDGKMDQAKKALKYCLDGLGETDRFALLNFATTVNHYRDKLTAVDKDQVAEAKKWVDRLEPSGGTAINDALAAALELRATDSGRTFTVVLLTDGKPTIGETNPDKILANVGKKNSANTRIFTFGVGNDLNATFLDLLADQTRAASSFVRPGEDMEVKVSAFFDKISKPALTNLKLVAGTGVRLHDVYPPQLPDLFHGQQLIVMGRYQGQGAAAITLTGTVGTDTKEYVYELDFAAKAADKPFVEELWGRRKVGYLLEQIRLNGEKKELVDEVTALAKKYSIATPYTSYLVVPDGPMPVSPGARGGRGPLTQNGGGGGFGLPPGAAPALAAGAKDGKGDAKVLDFARQNQKKEGELAENRGRYADEELAKAAGANKPATGYPGAPAGGSGGGVGGPGGYPAQAPAARAAGEAKDRKDAYDQARAALRRQDTRGLQTDKLGVDLSCNINDLKNQARLQQKALQCVGSRNCLEIGGVWIDEGFTEKTPVCSVKALSDGYFRILERRPEMKDVFRLGNHLVWIAPSGTALVIDTNDGKEQLTDEEIDKLFTAAK